MTFSIYLSLPTTYQIEVGEGDASQAPELTARIMKTWAEYVRQTQFDYKDLLERQVLLDTFLQSFDDDFNGKDID